MFEKVTQAKASVVVAEQIVEAIKNGSLPVGSRLPSENELAEQMGVSRPTVREALSALAAVGLIESRPGSGNFVRNPSNSTIREAFLILENESSCLEIMEARGLLEPPVASLAAQKRTEQNIEELRLICANLERLAKQGDFDPYLEVDKEFHLAVVRAAGNTLLSSVLTLLINTMDQRLYREFTHDYYFKSQLGLEEVASLHGKIFEAIVAGDSELAKEKMCEHWQRMQEAVSAG